MKTRNYANEILNKKKHFQSNIDGFNKVYERVRDISILENFYEDALINGFSENEQIAEELDVYGSAFLEGIKYIPVSLVACIESFFRFLFSHVIDSNTFYKDQASKFDIKFSLKTAIDLEANKLTIGEFISHLLRVNNLDDINENMSQILGEDFLKGFKYWRKTTDITIELFPLSDEEKDSAIINTLKHLFELRHSICHEAYTPIDEDDVRKLISFSPYVRDFLLVTEKYVEEHIKETNK